MDAVVFEDRSDDQPGLPFNLEALDTQFFDGLEAAAGRLQFLGPPQIELHDHWGPALGVDETFFIQEDLADRPGHERHHQRADEAVAGPVLQEDDLLRDVRREQDLGLQERQLLAGEAFQRHDVHAQPLALHEADQSEVLCIKHLVVLQRQHPHAQLARLLRAQPRPQLLARLFQRAAFLDDEFFEALDLAPAHFAIHLPFF